MAKYYVLINGQNFLVDKRGQIRKYGFFTTRCVDADGPQQAEVSAISLLRRNQSLKKMVRNAEGDQPMLYVEEVAQVEPFHSLPRSEQGFSWYPEDE